MYLTWQAAFIPSLDNAQDTSYFSSRFTWNSNDSHFMNDNSYNDSSDDESTCSGSSSDFEEAVRLTGLYTLRITKHEFKFLIFYSRIVEGFARSTPYTL